MKLPRLLAATAFAGVLVLGQLVGVSPANAYVDTPACNYDHINFNACLRFYFGSDPNELIATAGLDAYMSPGYAQDIVRSGASVRAQLWGDDGGNGRDQYLGDLTVSPGWPAVIPNGLGMELSATTWRSDLNEDVGEDEIYALVTYSDSHNGRNITYRTGTVRGYFDPVGGGPPQCLLC